MKKEFDELIITKHTPKEHVIKIVNEKSHKACPNCAHACKHTSGIFLKHEIKKFAEEMNMTEEQAKKEYMDEVELFNTKVHRAKQIKTKLPHGRCVFLTDNNLCSIHDFKPLYCRVGTCEPKGEQTMLWFTLNHLVNENDPESIRQWASYLKTHPTISGGELHELVPDEDKLKKILNYEMLK